MYSALVTDQKSDPQCSGSNEDICSGPTTVQAKYTQIIQGVSIKTRFSDSKI